MIFNFVEAYSRTADEQHGAHLIPERLPTGQEVSDMLGNIDIIKRSLEQVRDLVQTSIQNERTCEGAKLKGPNEEEYDAMYTDAMKPQYGMTEVKKRRRVRLVTRGKQDKAHVNVGSVRFHLADAIAATESTPRNGDEDLMEGGRYAMHAASTMQNC